MRYSSNECPCEIFVYGWNQMKLSTNHGGNMGELHAKFHQNWWSGFRDIVLHNTDGHSFIIIRIQRNILVTYILWMIISSIRCELHDPGSFSPILNDRQSRISTYRFYTLNSQRSEKTQLTQDMYKFCFKLYTIRNRNTRKVSCMKVHWSLSLGL